MGLLISLTFITLLTQNNFYFLSSLFVLLAGVLLSFSVGLGFGDVKLLVVISLFFLPPHVKELSQFIAGITVSAGLLIAITVFRGGSSRDPVAFAPCIFAGALLCASLA